MTFDRGRLAANLTGVGLGGGGLKKLTIAYEIRRENHYDGRVSALFNPSELSFSREISWQQKTPAVSDGRYVSAYAYQDFVRRQPQTLTVSLFFDTYESHADTLSLGHLRAAVLPANPLTDAPEATSVAPHIEALARLSALDQELHRPPRCRLRWGDFEVFWGVLTNLQHSYTMFLADGTPVRAKATCTFTEFGGEYYARGSELHSADVAKARVVRRGETLHSIAAEEYGDPALWRHLARANGIRNPRDLAPGALLKIPALRP
jgi:hypothetical protein